MGRDHTMEYYSATGEASPAIGKHTDWLLRPKEYILHDPTQSPTPGRGEQKGGCGGRGRGPGGGGSVRVKLCHAQGASRALCRPYDGVPRLVTLPGATGGLSECRAHGNYTTREGTSCTRCLAVRRTSLHRDPGSQGPAAPLKRHWFGRTATNGLWLPGDHPAPMGQGVGHLPASTAAQGWR